MSIAKYIGPAVTLVVSLGTAALSVCTAVITHHVPGTIIIGLISVGSGYIVVKYDWPLKWKPLFTSK